MSNRRKTKPARDGAPAALSRDADGTIKVVWTRGRPNATVITADALEALVDAHNEAVKAAPPEKRTLLARLGGWSR